MTESPHFGVYIQYQVVYNLRKENPMPISAKQLNCCDVSTDFDKFYHQNQNNLLSLLDQFVDISTFIPFSFYQRYYAHFGKKRDFSLESMLRFFILKNLLSIPTVDLLITLS